MSGMEQEEGFFFWGEQGVGMDGTGMNGMEQEGGFFFWAGVGMNWNGVRQSGRNGMKCEKDRIINMKVWEDVEGNRRE